MLPPSFLRHRVRAVAVFSAGLMGFVFYGTLLVMSLYFQDCAATRRARPAQRCCR